jgi:phosphate-selective porin
MRNLRSFNGLLVVMAVVCTAAPRPSQGQSSAGSSITFESLKAKQKPEAAPSQSSGKERDEVAKLRRIVAAQADSLAARRAAIRTKTDTVRVERLRIDTVRVERLRIDTVRAAAPVSPPVTVPPAVTGAPSVAAVSYVAPTFAGLLQMWAVAGDAGYRNTYRVRRAELKTVVDLGDHAKGTVMLDLAKALSLTTTATTAAVSQSSRVLQDAFISTPVSRVQVDVGQMKLPLGKEGMASSASLETVERALMFSDRARGGSFGDVRDLGAQVRGAFAMSEFQAGVFNGSGESQNDVDKNVGKSFVGRAALRPIASANLQLGMSGATAGRASADKATRDRIGGEVEYRGGPLMLRSEVIRGQDGAIARLGYYALATLAVRPTVKLVTRYDTWDPDTHKETTTADVTERDYLIGASWFPPQTRLKLQFAGVRRTYAERITPAVTQALLNVQASW